MPNQYDEVSLHNLCNDTDITYDKTNISSTTYVEGKCSTERCNGTYCRKFSDLYKRGDKCRRCLNPTTYNLNFLIGLNLSLNKEYSVDKLNAHCIIEGKCKNKTCKNNFKRKFCELIKIGGFCKQCALIHGNEKKVNTTIKRYGVENISQLDSIKTQKEETCTKNHGVPYATQSPVIQQQIVKTSLENWGTQRPTQNRELLTNMADSLELKTGYRSPFKNPEVLQKIEDTNMTNLGVPNPFSSKLVQSKIKKTCEEKYGYSNPMQNPLISRKAFITGCRLKPYKLPSGKIIHYMGFEKYALLDLIKIYNEDDIENETLPVFNYTKPDGTLHTYLPDIYIKSINTFIEVKSTYTITQDINVILLKQQSVKNAGYKCKIWVYGEVGKKVEKVDVID
jgi:hypothetical protein